MQNDNKTTGQNEITKIIASEYLKYKKYYQGLKSLQPKEEAEQQIERDISRTFPRHAYFQQGEKGKPKLRKVLQAFSCYDEKVDYVQGMNFLVGQLLMHCSGTLTFWLFVELIEECELRDIYQVGLPGL